MNRVTDRQQPRGLLEECVKSAQRGRLPASLSTERTQIRLSRQASISQADLAGVCRPGKPVPAESIRMETTRVAPPGGMVTP